MTTEQAILEILRLIGLPGAIGLGLILIVFFRSRADLEKSRANVVEASAQASIAKDNADTVRKLAHKSEEDIAVLMKHVLEGQQQVVNLTELVGQVRLDLTTQINQVRIQNAELQTEARIRRESEEFLQHSVVAELKHLRRDIKDILEDGKSNASEIPANTGTEGSSPVENTEPQSNNIQRADESVAKVSPVSGGSPTG